MQRSIMGLRYLFCFKENLMLALCENGLIRYIWWLCKVLSIMNIMAGALKVTASLVKSITSAALINWYLQGHSLEKHIGEAKV